MNDESTEHSSPPAPSMVQSEEVDQFFAIVKRYGTPVLVGTVLAAGIVVALNARHQGAAAKEVRANVALTTAETAEDYQHVLDLFGDTATSQIAALGLGARSFDEGNFAEAEAAYASFVQAHPDHPLRESAELCLAQCQEGAGDLEKALATFQDFSASHPDHYLAPYAQLGAGRCFQQLGRWEDARILYEEVIVDQAGTPWGQMADLELVQAQRMLRAP